MALRALKTEEEIAGIPLDQPVLIELPGGMLSEDSDPVEPEKAEKKPEVTDPDAKKLQEQLEAAQAAQKAERERADKAERETAEARRLANQKAREADEARKRNVSLEGDIISGGLQAAQSERDAAKQALQQAGEAGDWKAIADAQSRIGRAEAKILAFESGAAEVAERKQEKPEPKHEATPSFADQVSANPKLLSVERDWMIRNEASFRDNEFNIKLEAAYAGAINKGLVRGSPEYFDHIERATGLKAAPTDDDSERNPSVQAPPSRSERGTDGRQINGRIMLSPEERDICKSMGISEVEYARQKVAFEVARKNDPEKYANRG